MPNEQPPKTNPETNSVNRTARQNARRYALQAIYQWQLAEGEMSTIEKEFLTYHIDKKIDLNYFKELIHGILENQQTIDTEIQAFTDRPISEIDSIELGVLRIAIYELIQRPDVPYRVSINEALELTKKFGSIEGYKFVNGILDRVAKKHRQVEITMHKDKRG